MPYKATIKDKPNLDGYVEQLSNVDKVACRVRVVAQTVKCCNVRRTDACA